MGGLGEIERVADACPDVVAFLDEGEADVGANVPAGPVDCEQAAGGGEDDEG